MCELLVRIQDNPLTGDAATDCQRTMRGDVIVAMPDGHDWTPRERQSPHWVIVKVPEMSLAEGEALASPELPQEGKRFHRKKAFHIDSSLLPRVAEMREVITLSAEDVRKAKRRKPPVADPHVIG